MRFIITATLILCVFAIAANAATNSSAQTFTPALAKSSDQMIAEIAALWTGEFSNQRQVDVNMTRNGPTMPELTRDPRKMTVVKIDAPQLGRTILFFEESRIAAAEKAQRQRVVSPVFDDETQKVRAMQFFFKEGPTYDRKPLEPLTVAKKAPADFRREAK